MQKPEKCIYALFSLEEAAGTPIARGGVNVASVWKFTTMDWEVISNTAWDAGMKVKNPQTALTWPYIDQNL